MNFRVATALGFARTTAPTIGQALKAFGGKYPIGLVQVQIGGLWRPYHDVPMIFLAHAQRAERRAGASE